MSRMKYPSTFVARQSGCIAFFWIHDNATGMRSQVSFLLFLFPYSKDNLSFPFSPRRGVRRPGLRAAARLCGISVQVRRCPLWVATALWADDAPSTGWMLLPSQSRQLGRESAVRILVTTCLLGLCTMQKMDTHVFLYLSWGSDAALPWASCVTLCLRVWVSSRLIKHWIWGQ